MSGYAIKIFLEKKWLNHLRTGETLIRCCILQHLIWVCTVCQYPFWVSRLNWIKQLKTLLSQGPGFSVETKVHVLRNTKTAFLSLFECWIRVLLRTITLLAIFACEVDRVGDKTSLLNIPIFGLWPLTSSFEDGVWAQYKWDLFP